MILSDKAQGNSEGMQEQAVGGQSQGRVQVIQSEKGVI